MDADTDKPRRKSASRVTEGTLKAILDALTVNPVLADAMRRVNMHERSIFALLSRSKRGDERLIVTGWPDPEDPTPIAFHDACALAMKMHVLKIRQIIARDVAEGTPRVLRDPSGRVIFKQDYKATAIWGGDVEAARTLGGLTDPFYEHDENGARVPEVVYDVAPASLRIHAARSWISGMNPSDRVENDVKHSGGVLVIGATTPPNAPRAAIPDYSRPKQDDAQKPDVLPPTIAARFQQRERMLDEAEAHLSNPNRRTRPEGVVKDAVGNPIGARPMQDQADDVPLPPKPQRELRDSPRAYEVPAPQPRAERPPTQYPKGNDPHGPNAKAMKVG
jgi:hypothetical protein